MLVKILIYLIFLNQLLNFGNGAFLGGTVSWFSLRNKGFRFVYRMTWDKGSGPCGAGCSLSNIGRLGSLTQELVQLSWNCTKGCSNNTTLHDVNYYTTTASNSTPGYEQGENYFFPNFGAGTGPYEVTLDGLLWGQNFTGLGRLITTVNSATRNDTNLPNASPIAAPPPYLGFQFGCVSEFKLPIEDPDEDTMRCRFSTISECGSACTSNLKGLTINTENCTLTIDASDANGFQINQYYRVAVTVEDFPDYTIKVGGELHKNEKPFSSIPLQFSFRVVNSTETCGTNSIQIALPTANNGIRIAYPKGNNVYTHAIYWKTPIKNSTYVVVSNPAKFKYNQYDDDNNRTDVTRIYGTWSDVDNNQYADTLSCSWALNGITGLTSAQQCFTPMIYDMQNCITNSCNRNGTCIDLWHRPTCRCPYGYKRPDCSRKITCADSPCRNNQSCVESGGVYRCYMSVSTSSSVNTAAIVAGTIAALVAAAATSCCCWYFLAGPGSRKKKQEKQVTPDTEEEQVGKTSNTEEEQADKTSPEVENESDRPKTAKPVTDNDVTMTEIKDETPSSI